MHRDRRSYTDERSCRIDYLLYQSSLLRLLEVDELPPLARPIPDEAHPSDHLPIGARFHLLEPFESVTLKVRPPRHLRRASCAHLPHALLCALHPAHLTPRISSRASRPHALCTRSQVREWFACVSGASLARPLSADGLQDAFQFFDKVPRWTRLRRALSPRSALGLLGTPINLRLLAVGGVGLQDGSGLVSLLELEVGLQTLGATVGAVIDDISKVPIAPCE